MNRWISKIPLHIGYFHLKLIVEVKRFVLPVHVEIFPFKMYCWNSYEVQKMPQLWLEIGRKQFLCCLLFIAFFTMGYWLIYRCFVLCQRILHRFAQFLKFPDMSRYLSLSLKTGDLLWKGISPLFLNDPWLPRFPAELAAPRPPIHRHIVCHQIMAGKSSLEQEFNQGWKMPLKVFRLRAFQET